ncbi:MAG: cytochrome c oxidase subunit 3 [Myxococcales bacterium]|nr:cytochrome c oxidase subunit 3 [Myxococcales bacterium]
MSAHAAEAMHDDDHGHEDLVENNYMKVPNVKLAIWTFLGSECMFFGSLIATYFFYLDKSITGPLPGEVFSIGITSISTFILLMSSFTMAMAVDSAKSGTMTKSRNWLFITAFLGAIFVGFQVYEFWHFVHLGLTLQTSLFGSTFYVMTGFHGAHVSVGVIWLIMVGILAHKGNIPAEKAVMVESAGLYWHFVDIVWIIIFTFVYLLEFAK